jgi:putative transposon-encoded protein
MGKNFMDTENIEICLKSNVSKYQHSTKVLCFYEKMDLQ